MNTIPFVTLSAALLLALTSTGLSEGGHGHEKGNRGFVSPAHFHTPADANFQFTEIHLPPGSLFNDPGAWGLNNNGTIVGNCNLITDFAVQPGLIYRDGAITVLPPAPFAGSGPEIIPGFPEGALGNPTGINNAETAVGWYTDADGLPHGCSYTAVGGWIALPDAIPTATGSGPVAGWATGINNRGDIVGMGTGDASGDTDMSHGFLLHRGQYTLLDGPDGSTGTEANGINDNGDIVGDYFDESGNQHGFLLQGGVYTTLDYPEAVWTFPFGLNNRGQIVGTYGSADGDNHGFLLSNGLYTTHDFPGTSENVLTGINDSGEVSGVYNWGLNAFFGVPIRGH